jgi:predicted nuclease of predicted toxin-antitoxin system
MMFWTSKKPALTGYNDAEVIQLAKKENRVLLTLDRYFTNIFLFPPSQTPGIVVVRVKPTVPAKVDAIVNQFIEHLKPEDVYGALSIISERGTRTFRDAL